MNDPGSFVLTRPRSHQEADLQRACMRYLRWCLPDTAVAFSIPNDGFRHKGEAARLVGLGLTAGVPDVLCISSGHPIFLELKTAKGILSSLQRQMHQKLERAGAAVHVCRRPEDVQAVLLEAGVALRGKLA